MIQRATTMPVYDVMTRAPVTVSPVTTVSDLIALFDRHDFNAFPVVDTHGRLVGVVSKLDVLRAFLTGREPSQPADGSVASEPVEALMTTEVVSVGPGDDLVLAGELMVGAKLQSLPVLERRDGAPALMGIVSRGDVLRGLRYRLVDLGDLGEAP